MLLKALFLLLLQAIQSQEAPFLSQKYKHGTIKIEHSVAHITNLHRVHGCFFVVLRPGHTKTLETLPKTPLQLGIGLKKPGIYFNKWHMKDTPVHPGFEGWKQTGMKTTMPFADKRLMRRYADLSEYSQLIPIYVFVATHEEDIEKQANTVQHTQTTVLFATMWDNLFRIYYAVYGAYYSLALAGVSPNNLHFLDVYNAQHEEINRQKNQQQLRHAIASHFGEHTTLQPSPPSVYQTVVAGVASSCLLQEIAPAPARDLSNTKAKDAWQHLGNVLYNQFKHRQLPELKEIQKEARLRDYFLVLYASRKHRDIQNPEIFLEGLETLYASTAMKKKLIWRKVDFETMEYGEQIRLVSRCDLLISHHGAALAHMVYMKPASFVLELFPYKFQKTVYRNLAAMLGHSYFSWQNTNSALSTSLDGSPFDDSLPFNMASMESREHYRNQNTILDTPVRLAQLLSSVFQKAAAQQDNEKYLLYLPWEQLNNQISALKNACIISQALNRTLVIPPLGYRKDAERIRIETVLQTKQPGKHTDPETSFNSLEYIWMPMANCFEQKNLEKLPCKTIMLEQFKKKHREIPFLYFEPSTTSRYTKKQAKNYYKEIADIPFTTVMKNTKAVLRKGLEYSQIAPWYSSTKDMAVLALGMVFNKLKHNPSEEYPPTKYYDYMVNPYYKKVTRALQYSRRLTDAADRAIAASLGPAYTAIHVRRGDYGIKSGGKKDEHCIQSNDYICKNIANYPAGTVFVASNEPALKEELNAQCGEKHQFLNIDDLLPAQQKSSYDEQDIAILDQLVCIKSSRFIGNYFSSYTRSIVEYRQKHNSFW